MSRVRFSSVLALATLAGGISLGGCVYEPRELELTYEVAIRPSHFCSGERLNVSYLGSDRVDWVRVHAADGTELLALEDGRRAGLTAPMRAEWLPLRSVVRLKDGDELEHSLAARVTCIDQATWVAYGSTEELRDPVAVERELVGTVRETDSETGEEVVVRIYDVYQDFVGFRWSVPREDFGNRAHLLRVRNGGERLMEFTATYVWGEQFWALQPGESVDVPMPTRPWLTLDARYRPPERRLVAWQKGEVEKPEGEHFQLVDLYEEEQYRLELEVVCRDVDS